jgi:hypothetical protein
MRSACCTPTEHAETYDNWREFTDSGLKSPSRSDKVALYATGPGMKGCALERPQRTPVSALTVGAGGCDAPLARRLFVGVGLGIVAPVLLVTAQGTDAQGRAFESNLVMEK